ncbi:hypothetical protein [Sneathiella litorea]|uniref:Uncharacterized protein n=1 Tax=Sneathiella litorea TaxID=2606216 RepID=A0A6L8W9F5_9PROT|nr:hypothetical protein [Sneathiella litorea]MZR30867.1 hypothetical protein [Sneathiella litorea]
MAYAIPMIEPHSRKRAIAYSGISWSCLFFGPFPALYRGHILGFVGMSLVNLATLGFSMPVFIFVYNAWHYHSLLARGYQPARNSYSALEEESVYMSPSLQDYTEDIYDTGDAPRQQQIRLASPKLSDRLIDDHRQGAFLKK